MPRNANSSVISPTLSTAYHQAKGGKPFADHPKPMARTDKVLVVKEYPRPEFRTPTTKEDTDRADRVELGFLRGDIKRHKDKIRRLEDELSDEIKMLTAAMDGVAETYDEVKRRISRLRGAIAYVGRMD